MKNPKQSTLQAELLRVLTAIQKQRIKAQLQKMTPEEVDRAWQSLILNEKK